MSQSREIAELLARLRLGEDSTLEMKAVVLAGDKVKGPAGDSIADELGSLANSLGGDLVLGVDDATREVSGIALASLDAVEHWLANLINDRIDPPPIVHVRRVELPTKAGELRPVLWVTVPKSLFVHRSPDGYLYRVGSTKRVLSTEQLARLMQQRNRAGIVWYDEMPVVECGLDALNEPLWRRFLGGGVDAAEVQLAKMKVLTTHAGSAVASVAGCLMCSEEPRRWMRSAYVQCVRYLGTERTADQQHDALDATGPLDAQIVDATRFVLRNMHTGARKDIGREDFPQYSGAAVFEAVANAVAHRDYSLPGSVIRVHQYADRVEIDTPGALANTQTIDSLPYKQATRNELIVSLLARCPVEIPGVRRRTIMDKRGEGVPLLLRESERLSGRRPEYAMVDADMLKLTLFAATTPRDAQALPPGFGAGDYGAGPYGGPAKAPGEPE